MYGNATVSFYGVCTSSSLFFWGRTESLVIAGGDRARRVHKGSSIFVLLYVVRLLACCCTLSTLSKCFGFGWWLKVHRRMNGNGLYRLNCILPHFVCVCLFWNGLHTVNGAIDLCDMREGSGRCDDKTTSSTTHTHTSHPVLGCMKSEKRFVKLFQYCMI